MKPLPPRKAFLRHLLSNVALAGSIIGSCLAIGVVGYHAAVGLAWIDALLNASMILAGMGPVDPITTPGGKLFASAYALFSGVAFITCIGVLLAPALHHFLHRFHLELAEEDADEARDAPDRQRGR